MRAVLISIAVLAAFAGRAHAYPQFQLARDTTCTACHLSPDGGGILNENGIATAEGIAWKPGDSNWMYGAKLPGWLQMGGDLRGAAGFVDNGNAGGDGYPMQAEVAATAGGKGFTLNVVGGLRSPDDQGSAAHVLWSREHYLMWQQNPGENQGLYVRIGRLMPTFGLRLAEHIVYTQRFGARPLYGEVYAAAASYVHSSAEVHVTAFVHDPIGTPTEHGDGGAIYVEKRLGEHAAIGASGKYSTYSEAHRTYGGLTGKLYLPGPDLLFQAEAEVIRQKVMSGSSSDSFTQLAGYLLATKPLNKGVLLDMGVGHYTQDTRVKGLYRDCVDVNLHWFMTSHIEWLATFRAELLDGGSGPNGGYALAQFHYRL